MPRIHPVAASEASASLKEAWEQHLRDYPGSRITNMKATLSHSVLAFEVYMRWYPLYQDVIAIVGERLAYLFAHAVSEASDCLICTTFFRRLISQHGEQPDALTLTPDEHQLLDFGAAIARHRGEVPNALYEPVQSRFNPNEMVTLVAFAGQMIATNVFNNVLRIELDAYLYPYTLLTSSKNHG